MSAEPTALDELRPVRSARATDGLARVSGAVAVALSLVFLLAPVLVVIALSFSDDEFFAFPPESWGLRQYTTLVEDDTWSSAIGLSLRIAIPVTLIAALIAVPAVLVAHRSRLPGRHLIEAAGLTSLIIPISAYAVAMYGVFVQFDLLGTYLGLLIANLVLALPFMLLVTAAALSRIPVELELAAMTLGAGRARAWIGITLRLLVPAIVAGGLLTFITSFDEAVFINFLAGPDQVTLPKAIFDSVRLGVDPAITAIATLLMVGVGLLMLVAARLRKGIQS